MPTRKTLLLEDLDNSLDARAVLVRGGLEARLDDEVGVSGTSREEFGDGAQEEQVPVRERRAANVRARGSTRLLGAVVEQQRDHALKRSVLDHRVDDQNKGGAETAPEALDAVGLEDLLDGLGSRHGLLLAVGSGDGMSRLVRLHGPDGAGREGRDGAWGSESRPRPFFQLTSNHASSNALESRETRSRSRVGRAAADNSGASLLVRALFVISENPDTPSPNQSRTSRVLSDAETTSDADSDARNTWH